LLIYKKKIYFRQEMERKRLQEWEKQRKDELTAHRQREQDKLFAMKARQDNLNTDLEKLVCNNER
jgi:hypothetical protein